MPLEARHACINYQSNVEYCMVAAVFLRGNGVVFKYSTDALVWYSNSTYPFPCSSRGSARKGDEDETSDDVNEEEERYNFSYIGHSRASVPKGCCTVKTCI